MDIWTLFPLFWLWWIMLPWTFVNKILCQVIFSIFLDIYLGVELLGHMLTLCLIFEELPNCFPGWLPQFYHPTNFSTSTLVIDNTWYCLSFWLQPFYWPGVSHYSIYLHFPNDYWCWTFLYLLIGHLYIFFGKTSIQIICPFLKWVICLFIVEL